MMTIGMRKTVLRMMRLFVGCFAFIVGLTAFYFYAEAAAFLFKPKQPTPETTQSLTPETATPPAFSYAPVTAPTLYPAASNPQPVCESCIQDDLCGLCEQLTGEYENYDYSYALTIPDELRALKTPSPAADHGFIGRLSSDSDAVIEVEGSYNADAWNSLNEAVNAHIEYLKAGAKDVVVLKRGVARLGKRSAARYVIQYTSLSTGLSMIEDKTIALRKDGAEKEYWTFYAVSLQTPASRYERNIVMLEKVLKRWKEIESGGC